MSEGYIAMAEVKHCDVHNMAAQRSRLKRHDTEGNLKANTPTQMKQEFERFLYQVLGDRNSLQIGPNKREKEPAMRP